MKLRLFTSKVPLRWRPCRLDLLIVMVFLCLSFFYSVLVDTNLKYTSKVTWVAAYGAPLGYVNVSGYSIGACSPKIACSYWTVDGVVLANLLVDLVVYYMAAQIITAMLRRRYKNMSKITDPFTKAGGNRVGFN